MLPGELVLELTGLPWGGGAKSVKRFERSNGLDTMLYKTYTVPLRILLESFVHVFPQRLSQ